MDELQGQLKQELGPLKGWFLNAIVARDGDGEPLWFCPDCGGEALNHWSPCPGEGVV
jgi:hypothetical protein